MDDGEASTAERLGHSVDGGNCRIRPTEVTSSGTVSVQLRQACSTSAERSQGKNSAPA